MRHFTLRQLRIFEAAARHLHFGHAAKEVHLTQPAVSIQLKQLEASVGLPLFEQVGRRMHLTRAGEELLRHSKTVLPVNRRVREARAWYSGQLALSPRCSRVRRSIRASSLGWRTGTSRNA